MHFDEIVTFIKTVPVFYYLDLEHLTKLSQQASVRDFHDGETLLTQGEESSELFIMVQGEAASFSEGNIGFERELRRFYPGDYFGMLNVLTRERSASAVRTIGDGKSIVVTRETIETLFEESSSFGRAVCRSLASFLRENIVRIPAIPFERLESFPNLEKMAALLPARISEYCQALVVDRDNDRLKVAIVNPNDTRACEFIKDVLKKFDIEFVAISADDFHRYSPTVVGAAADVSAGQRFEQLVFVDANGQRAAIAETDEQDVLSKALAAAIHAGASDIHVEPAQYVGGRIRFRLDGRMVPFRDDIPLSALRQMVARLKVMAEMDITNVRRPQDGRFSIIADDQIVEFRVSVMPCQGGEKTVLRVVAPGNNASLSNLFVSDAVAQFAREIFLQPSGLVLVTGPTGSGKTTSLYAALQMLNAENLSRNIVTVEDPVEYSLDFATQTQVDNHVGLDFSSVLRAVLRQDPDIILVGEIRDRESASLAIEAATTGHLVLSSLHTHSALETLVRLRNLDVPSYMLADALKGVISQKLLSRIHPAYSEPVGPDEPVIHRLRERGILNGQQGVNLQRGRETDGGPAAGESGRVALFEFLSASDTLCDLIERQASRGEIERNLSEDTFFRFEKYARMLLQGGHVAPEQIERTLPKQPSLATE